MSLGFSTVLFPSRAHGRPRPAALRLATLLLGSFGFASMAAAQPAPAAAADCAGLAALALPNAQIILATRIDGTFNEDTAVGREGRVYRDLPPFCRVRGISRPVAGSEIGFEVWLPLKGWNGRLHMVGNGAYSSNIYYAQMIDRLRDGDVAVGTNTGHVGRDLSFGIGHPERIVDFAYRAVHESAVAAKAVTAAYYGSPARYSYFSGCSTGGYQGLSEAQRYPDDFDGIIAGAPGNNRTRLTLAFLWNYLANHRPGDDRQALLDEPQLALINRTVTAQCDRLDGVADGVVSDPRLCDFKLASLQCRAGQRPDPEAPSCLSAEQIAAADKIYQGPRDARNGAQIYPGYPFGTEGVSASEEESHLGWSGYWADNSNPQQPSRLDFFRHWVKTDPDWNWWNFDWGNDVDEVIASIAGTFDANNPDLDGFAARNGKLIMFMGWQDPVGAPGEAINYYDAVEARAPGATVEARRAHAQQSLRLYMVPGMAHCAGGPGATNFSTATRNSRPPVDDARHNMLRALEAWVEQGHAPEALIATRYADGKSGAIALQRPICVHPQVPRYQGGPENEASSFRCVTPLSSTPTRLVLPDTPADAAR